MNCADVTRIVNTGSYAKVSEVERDAVAAHARTCRDCAAVWATHARLAGLRIPPMPAELTLRCQTLGAVGPQSMRNPLRRLTVVGGLAALAAAAAAWMWYWNDPPRDSSAGTVAAAAPLSPVAAEPVALPAESEEAMEPGQATTPAAEAIAPATNDLPLVPPPGPHVQDPKTSQLALQKAIERHPEMVDGPPLDSTSMFFVSVTMKADGTVLNSAAELATPETSTEIANRLARLLPVGGGEHIVTSADSGMPLPDGRGLRARVFLQGMIISDAFDVTRSNVRVREILGRKYDDFMTPHSSSEGNVLTVLLSDDGRILREKVDRLTQDAALVLGLPPGARQEEVIAAKLGIGVQEIGAIGMTTLEQGALKIVVDQSGMRHVEGVKALAVRYAWTRRADESPAIQNPPRAQKDEADFNLVAATVVAERLLPGAFSHSPPSLDDMKSMPTVVFNARGEVIRAGRVQMRNGVDVDSLLQEQLVPGVSTGLHRTVRLTSRAGATAHFQFGWER